MQRVVAGIWQASVHEQQLLQCCEPQGLTPGEREARVSARLANGVTLVSVEFREAVVQVDGRVPVVLLGCLPPSPSAGSGARGRGGRVSRARTTGMRRRMGRRMRRTKLVLAGEATPPVVLAHSRSE